MKNTMKKILCSLLVAVLCLTAAPLQGIMGIDLLDIGFSAQAASTITSYNRGDIIEFGWYPQSKVTDAKTIDALNTMGGEWISYNYYSGTGDYDDGKMTASDYMRYTDVLYGDGKYRGVVFDSYRPDFTGHTSSRSYQDDNGYSTNTVYWFKYEPIRWRVLDPATGMVITETILDSQPYNNYRLSSGTDKYGQTAYWGNAAKTHYANNYEKSSLREWLNTDFYDTAFSPEQQSIIATTTLDNSAHNDSYSAYDSASTTDKIFLLSYDDARNTDYGFSSGTGDNSARKAKGSDYAKCQGLYVCYGYSFSYLRSAGYSSDYSCYFTYSGGVGNYAGTSDTDIGVRPAFSFNPSSDINGTGNSSGNGDDDTSGPIFPAGYDFYEDSYRFTNYSDTVSKKYFTTLYGADNGKLLYKKKKKQGGLCFGFSYTTASIYNDLPPCSVISTYDKGLFSYKFCDNIRDIWNLSVDFLDFTTHTTNITSSAFVVGNQTITIEDYIKYAQIYQYSNNVNNGSVWCNDANDILELVKDYTDANRIGVTIGMTHDSAGGHRVLAVGYDGNDILVDDPNYKSNYQRITVNADGSWSFSGLSNWNSNTCDIRYNLDYHRPYQLLLTGRTTTVAEKWIDDNINVSEHYIEGMNILNKDSCLLAVNADGYTIENENLTKIISEELEGTENEDFADMYWLANDKAITIEDFNGEDSLIEFSGNGKILSLETDADGSVTFDVANANVSIQTKEKEEYQLVIEDCYQDEAFNDIGVIVAVSGTASGDTITATQTETGLVVTGMSDGTVTLSIDDEVISTQTISDAISDIEITYDKTGEDENIEVDYEQPEEPTELEVPTEPEIPTDPTTPEEPTDDNADCSCMCHSKNSFMQFIYTIIRFFWQLFGVNMDCACGAKHFNSYFFG